MQYTYFKPTPTTPDEAKSLFRKLARQYHPDLHPEARSHYTEVMQVINAEYAAILTELEKHHQRARQEAAHKEGKKTAADFNDLDQVIEILREKIEAALNLNMQNVTVELCGLWVWVNGDTKPHKDALGKDGLGFKWAHEKKAWYYPGVKSFNRERRTMEEIRQMHGSQVFTKRKDEEESTAASLPA